MGDVQQFLEEAQKPQKEGLVLACLDIPMGDTDMPIPSGFEYVLS